MQCMKGFKDKQFQKLWMNSQRNYSESQNRKKSGKKSNLLKMKEGKERQNKQAEEMHNKSFELDNNAYMNKLSK